MRLVPIITGILFFSAFPMVAHALDGSEKLGNNEDVPKVESVESVAGNANSDERPPLSEEEMVNGIKEMLRIGTEQAVAKLARNNGFNEDPDVRIRLPDSLERVKMAMVRLDNMAPVDLFELRMNRAAEQATPKVAGYFILAINQITINDAQKIIDSSNDGATKYLKKRMKMGLSKVVRPIVKKSMRYAGTYNAYEDLMEQYRRIPFEPTVRGNVEDYMVEHILEAHFFYIGRQEMLMRTNPDDRPTETIKRLLSSP